MSFNGTLVIHSPKKEVISYFSMFLHTKAVKISLLFMIHNKIALQL